MRRHKINSLSDKHSQDILQHRLAWALGQLSPDCPTLGFDRLNERFFALTLSERDATPADYRSLCSRQDHQRAAATQFEFQKAGYEGASTRRSRQTRDATRPSSIAISAQKSDCLTLLWRRASLKGQDALSVNKGPLGSFAA